MTQMTLEFDTKAPRLTGQRLNILERLREGPATNAELNAICFRYGARIHELRGMGHKIKTVQLKAGVFRFELE
jgi:hypothetical protein